MDSATILITIITFIAWGVGSFISKLATNRIGEQAVFWDILANVPLIIIYSLIVFKFSNLSQQQNKTGILLASLAGLIGAVGFIGFYMLLNRAEASSVIPLTALYPALTAVLAFIFLKESVTPTKIAGIPFFCQVDGETHPATDTAYQCTECGRFICKKCLTDLMEIGRPSCPMCNGVVVMMSTEKQQTGPGK